MKPFVTLKISDDVFTTVWMFFFLSNSFFVIKIEMSKRIRIEPLSIEQLKTLYVDKDFWEIRKENELPYLCIIFIEIQKKKDVGIPFDVFLKEYRFDQQYIQFLHHNYQKKQKILDEKFSISLNEFSSKFLIGDIHVPKSERLNFLLNKLLSDFANLDERMYKYQKEVQDGEIFEVDKESLLNLNLLSHEKSFHYFSSLKFFEHANYYEELFWSIGYLLSKTREISENLVNKSFLCAMFYSDYIFRYLEYPIGIHDMEKIMLTDFNEDLIMQIQILYHKCKSKPDFKNSMKNFYYRYIMYEGDILYRKYKYRKKDIQKILFSQKKRGTLHPQKLAKVLTEVDKNLYNKLKQNAINDFIEKRLIDLKKGYFTRQNVLFVFFLIDFGFKIIYNVNDWFISCVMTNYKGRKFVPKVNHIPTICEFGINQWGVIHSKMGKQSMYFDLPILYTSFETNTFEKVLTKYFEILREIHPKMIKWNYESYNIMDLLNWSLTKYAHVLEEEEEDESRDVDMSQVPRIQLESNDIVNNGNNNQFLNLLNMAQKNYDSSKKENT